jgi:4-phosphopantoate--beta-alanine ligase
VTAHARDLADADESQLRAIVDEFDPEETRAAAEDAIRSGELA